MDIDVGQHEVGTGTMFSGREENRLCALEGSFETQTATKIGLVLGDATGVGSAHRLCITGMTSRHTCPLILILVH